MRRAGIIVSVATCFLATQLLAEERTRLFESGRWTLDLVEGLVIPYGFRSLTVDGVCNAYSPPGDVQLTLTMGAKGRHPPAKAAEGLLIRITSPKWNYPFREQPIFLIGGKNLFTPDGWYYGTSITWEPSVFRQDVSNFFATAANSSIFIGNSGWVESKGDILVVDADDQVLGRVPTDGLSEVFVKLKECAGFQ